MPIYDNENPHPEFGKNPNIKNVLGHTEYPKYVWPKDMEVPKKPTKADLANRVLVNNPTEEAEVVGETEELKDDKKDNKKSWGK